MKKFILTSVAALATLALVACGSDSSSSGSSMSLKADLQIDEEAQLFTMTYSQDVEKCIKDGGDFVWKNLGEVEKTDTYKYSFVGDTLVLRYKEGSYVESYGMVFVGGSQGSIKGTWKMLYNCGYHDGDIDCLGNEVASFSTTFKISGSSITIESESKAKPFDDYMSSGFVYYLVKDIARGHNIDVDESDLFDDYTEDMYEYLQDNKNVKASSVTKTSGTYTIDGVDYSIKVENAEQDEMNESYSAVVKVSSNGNSCTLNYEEAYTVTKSMCSAKNAEYFDLDSYEDENGNKFYEADEFYKSNYGEFSDCVEDMIAANEGKKSKEEEPVGPAMEDAKSEFMAACLTAMTKSECENLWEEETSGTIISGDDGKEEFMEGCLFYYSQNECDAMWNGDYETLAKKGATKRQSVKSMAKKFTRTVKAMNK